MQHMELATFTDHLILRWTTCVLSCVCMSVHGYMCICVCAYACMCLHMHACACVCVTMCVYISLSVCVYCWITETQQLVLVHTEQTGVC